VVGGRSCSVQCGQSTSLCVLREGQPLRLTPTPRPSAVFMLWQAQEVHADLRAWLSGAATPDIAGAVRIIYGGSVKGSNCAELIVLPDVDGTDQPLRHCLRPWTGCSVCCRGRVTGRVCCQHWRRMGLLRILCRSRARYGDAAAILTRGMRPHPSPVLPRFPCGWRVHQTRVPGNHQQHPGEPVGMGGAPPYFTSFH
jgi:hypothetical protein